MISTELRIVDDLPNLIRRCEIVSGKELYVFFSMRPMLGLCNKRAVVQYIVVSVGLNLQTHSLPLQFASQFLFDDF
jgi:hypothetical protein